MQLNLQLNKKAPSLYNINSAYSENGYKLMAQRFLEAFGWTV